MVSSTSGNAPEDGAADVRLRAALQSTGVSALLTDPDTRLLIAVIPDLDSPASAGPQMAAATMVNASGLRGLLAFTGVDSLTAWRADARPMPMPSHEVARLALANDCAAVVIDVLGPHRVAVSGADLDSLAATGITADRRGCP